MLKPLNPTCIAERAHSSDTVPASAVAHFASGCTSVIELALPSCARALVRPWPDVPSARCVLGG